ncbi:MFS transporter [Anatilimnocola sp. NA78]|uniref:MFS transporter n=1 Tax=Anatilimnocola sp. NA78 TaxID=3415683 RepID=UPI003CE59EF5
MHGFDEVAPAKPDDPNDNRPWYNLLSSYHWFVLTVAALGWLFDTMDQQLFNLARKPAMRELLTVKETIDGALVDKLPADSDINFWAGVTTCIFMMGWASGGLVFGVLGDRWGRAKVMLWTILIYSFCTGLSSLSTSVWDFAFYRFLTGLGVGGEFAVGISLVAEVMPSKARPFALGLLQALSTVGNITAAFINIGLGVVEGQGGLEDLSFNGMPITAWRIMFVIGTLPALLAILIRSRLKEPDTWKAVAASESANKQLGSYAELLGDPRWRRNAIVGLLMGFSGVVGLWGIGFFVFDLFGGVLRKHFMDQGLTGPDLNSKVALWVGICSVLMNVGAFFGIYGFSYLSHYIGRKISFAIAFIAAMFSTALVFSQLDSFGDLWMVPVMGFCQLSLFGGYAIYFPELFPTRLRSTGTSFCYNIGRFIAALGPLTLGGLTKYVFNEANGFGNEGLRWAGVAMCSVFLVGLFALPFAPETKGKPLPE